MFYNYVRFDSPFEFGQSYQLTVADQSSYGSFFSRLSGRALLNGATYFFTRSEDLISDFPYVTEGGMFYTYPVYIAGLYALTSKKVRAALRTNKLVLFLLGGMFSIGVIILMDIVWSPYLLTRYREDVAWLLGMLVFLAVGMRYADGRGTSGDAGLSGGAAVLSGEAVELSGGAAEQSGEAADPCEEAREFSSAVCLLALYSMLVCAFVFIQLDMKFFTPEQIAVIKKIVGAITFGV